MKNQVPKSEKSMWFSARKWAGIISFIASYLYFFVIITQIPLFRFPCRIGMCKTPVEVTACQLIASEIFPEIVVKALLYPGAIRKSISNPSHHQVLSFFKSNMRKAPATTDLKHLEVLAGSYLCVAGALLNLIKRRRMSVFGLCLILWGMAREFFITGKNATIFPNMAFTLFLAICSVRRDVRKLIKICKPKRVSIKGKNYSKIKYN